MTGHSVQRCRKRREFGINGCHKFDNRLLHNEKTQKGKDTSVPDPPTVVTACQNVHEQSSNEDKITLLKYIPVKLYGPEGTVEVIAFIDDGAKVSLLETEVARTLGLKGPQDRLSLRWIGNKTTSETSEKIDLEISAAEENARQYQMKNVRTTKKLSLPAQTLGLQNFLERHGKLRGIPIRDYSNVFPQLLIGVTHMNITRAESLVNFAEAFAAHKTKLGWVIVGSNEETGNENTVGHVCVEAESDDFRQQVSEFFASERFEPMQRPIVKSETDIRAEKILRDTTKFTGSKYETGLLWKCENTRLPDNYKIALKRLELMESIKNVDMHMKH